MTYKVSGETWVQLTAGAIELRSFMDHIDLVWQQVDEKKAHGERFDDLGFDTAYKREIGDFIHWVQEDRAPCLTWREGLRTVEIIEAAYRSADAGSVPVRLPLCPQREKN